MKKKEIIFTIGLCLLMGIIWVVGELVMGLWLPVAPWVYIVWRVGVVVITLGINVWHSLLEDETVKNPKREKYERKTSRRKK